MWGGGSSAYGVRRGSRPPGELSGGDREGVVPWGKSEGAPLGQVVRGSVPFFFLLLAGAVIVVAFPQIALWLPTVWVG